MATVSQTKPVTTTAVPTSTATVSQTKPVTTTATPTSTVTASTMPVDVKQMRDTMVANSNAMFDSTLKFIEDLPSKGIMSVFDSLQSFVTFYMLICLSALVVGIATAVLSTVMFVAGGLLLAVVAGITFELLVIFSVVAFGLMDIGIFVFFTAVPALLLFFAVNAGRVAFSRAQTAAQSLANATASTVTTA